MPVNRIPNADYSSTLAAQTVNGVPLMIIKTTEERKKEKEEKAQMITVLMSETEYQTYRVPIFQSIATLLKL